MTGKYAEIVKLLCEINLGNLLYIVVIILFTRYFRQDGMMPSFAVACRRVAYFLILLLTGVLIIFYLFVPKFIICNPYSGC